VIARSLGAFVDATQTPKLSVVIPCLNGADTIGDQLEALASQTWDQPWEVIVADNGSTDGTVAVVERYRERMPNLRVVDASDKRGAAHARNLGARAARARALAFCDADDEVGEGWVAAIGEALARHDFVAARQDTTKLNEPWVQEKGQSPLADGLPRLWYPPYLHHAGSGGLGVRRELHDAIGGFDESMLILDDTDYCIRLQLAGARLHLAPDAVIHYRYRTSLRALYHQARSYAEHNALLQKRYGRATRAPARWRWPLMGWKPLLAAFTGVHRKGGRAKLVWRLGWQSGRLRGSLKHRVLAL
jgi:glycosyltransferase involved in cell wall biosynthesis